MNQWKLAIDFNKSDDDLRHHRVILAQGKTMPKCVGSYEDGQFMLGDCESFGLVYEGDIDWFVENFDMWCDWPKN